MNARMPSRWSSPPNSAMKSSFSLAMLAGPGVLTAAWMASFAAARARRGPLANARASSTAASNTSSAGRTRSTSRRAFASTASTCRPV